MLQSTLLAIVVLLEGIGGYRHLYLVYYLKLLLPIIVEISSNVVPIQVDGGAA